MNTFNDPELRYWRRMGAVASLAVVTVFVAGLAIVGGTSSRDDPLLAVNCATQGLPATVFDDSGTHTALCSGYTPGSVRATSRSDMSMVPPPAPHPSARAEPLPPTF